MSDFEDLTIHYTISSIIFMIFQLAVIISSIFIIMKYPKSMGGKIMLVGNILTLLSMASFQILPFILNAIETDKYLKVQMVLSYLNTFTFIIFVVGFFIFAIFDLKKDHNKI